MKQEEKMYFQLLELKKDFCEERILKPKMFKLRLKDTTNKIESVIPI